MPDFNAEGSIASLAPTVAHLFGAATPRLASEPALKSVISLHSRVLGRAQIDRCIVFCPDALGLHIWNVCGDQTKVIERHAARRVPVTSVIPPKTPVCFASMFTGAQPHDHGIRKYERPVLRCETLFDVLIREGRTIAIVAVANSSVDLIFRDRDIDYFSEPDDAEVEERAEAVVRQDRHELVIVYQQEYDDALHATEPFSNRCLHAVRHHVNSFCSIAATVSHAWAGHNYATVFAPDHGAHVNPTTGHGDHGEAISEDMNLFHWYGISRK